jgi:exopolysaccharide biosynthesis protein
MRRHVHPVLILVSLLFTAATLAEQPTSQPYSGVRYWHESRNDPARSLYVVQIDLSNPDVAVRVAPAGNDPDGDGEWQTTLMPPSEIAAREHFDVCINASFFTAKNTKDLEGALSGYVAGKWASAEGIAMTDGKLWSSQAKKNWPAFYIDEQHHAHFLETASLPPDAKQAVQGNAFVLRDGAVPEPSTQVMKARHPRTVIGLDHDGNTLTILTVDGRRPGVSIGMTGPELGEEMKKLGCDTAMNLDGGGSTELLLREPDTGKLRVMNQPSDGRERAVADVVGISVHEAKRAH